MTRILKSLDACVSFLYLFMFAILLLEFVYCAVKFSQGGLAYVKAWLIHIQIEGNLGFLKGSDMTWLQALKPQVEFSCLMLLFWSIHRWLGLKIDATIAMLP